VHANFLVFLFLAFSFTWTAQASECLLKEALKDPKLSANGDFWAEYGKLTAKGKVSDTEMKALIEKHGGQASNSAAPSSSSTSFQPSQKVEIQHKATKEIKELPASLKAKVDEFIETAAKPGGLQEIRNNPGRWHLEKMAELDGKTFTVRLNGGYRVLFTQKEDSIEILRVNRDQIHNHLKTNH